MPPGVLRCRYCHAAMNGSDLPTPPEYELTAASDVVGGVEVQPILPSVDATPKSKRQDLVGTSHDGANRPVAKIKARSRQFQTAKVAALPPDSADRVDGALAAEAIMAPIPSPVGEGTWNRLLWLVAIMLLLPLCVSGPVPGASTQLSLGLPIVHSGDEPHHLVLINSVVRDWDLDVANNYANVHSGGVEAGRKFAGWPLDHHVNWYWNNHLVHWWWAYETDVTRWNKEADGHPLPTLQVDSIHRPISEREYSSHAPGVALLLAPVISPFRGTRLVEPVALLCSALATVAGMLAFYKLARGASVSARQAAVVTLVAFLGTPLWHYARVLNAEPYLMACAVGAYAAAFRWNNYIVAGCLLGIGTFLKVPFMLIGLPLAVEALVEKRWRDSLACMVPILGMTGLQLLINKRTHGGWMLFPQPWEWGFPAVGLFGLGFSWNHGLLLFSPLIIVGLVLGVPQWLRQQRREAILIGSATVLYIAMMSCDAQWWGGACYSSRLIMPIVPFLFLPLNSLISSRIWQIDRRPRVATWALAIVSVGFGAVAAFSCEHVWGKHPLEVLVKLR